MMADNQGYEILMPKFDSAAIIPNPVDQNKQFKIQLQINEETVVLYPEIRYSGTFYSGEDDYR